MIRYVFVDRDWDTMVATVTVSKTAKRRWERVYRLHNDSPSAKRLALVLTACSRKIYSDTSFKPKTHEWGVEVKKDGKRSL